MADKHNRLDSQFSIVSAFWEPQRPETVLTGTLTNNDEGLSFTTSPRYSYRNHSELLTSLMRLSGSGAIPRISVMHGFSEDGICTLCQLVEIAHPGLNDTSSGHWVEANSYKATVLVGGMHLGGIGDEVLTSARFTFTGLAEWLPIPPNEIWEAEHILLKIPLNAREVFSLAVPDSLVQVSLKVVSELKSVEDDNGRITRPVVFVEIATAKPESLTWYFDIGNRLENFFSLLLGSSVAMENMFVYRGDESGHIISERKRVVDKFRVFDCVRCTTSELTRGLEVWLTQPDEFRSIENLALGVLRKGDLFYETEFLSLSQALEGFHRVTSEPEPIDKATLKKVRKSFATLLEQEGVEQTLALRLCEAMAHANDTSFASRLEALCGRLSGPVLTQMGIDPKSFVKDVKSTRNFYTHTGNKASSRGGVSPVSGPELFFLNQKLRALLRAVLLQHLGLVEERISSQIIREATRWR